MFHHCLCGNNKNGLCYGNINSAYHDQIARGVMDQADWPNMEKMTYTDCPGYVVPGGDMYDGVKQGVEGAVVKPFNPEGI